MGLKFRRGSTAQQSGSLAFGEPYVNTTLGTLVVGGATGDIVLSSAGTGSTGNFGAISGSGLDITGNANIAGNLTLGGNITIGDNTADSVNVVASLSSSLIPSITNAFDLGSADKFWRDLYISTGSIKFVGAGGNVLGTLTNTGNGLNLDGGVVTNGNSSFGTASVSVTSVTGSLRVSGSLIVSGTITTTDDISTYGNNINLYHNGTTIISGSTIQFRYADFNLNGTRPPTLGQGLALDWRYGGVPTGSAGGASVDWVIGGTGVSYHTMLSGHPNGLNVNIAPEVGGTLYHDLLFPNNTGSDYPGYQYTFPSANGTIALTSNLTSGTTSVSNLNSFSSSALTRLTALEVETSNLETFTASLSTTSNVRFGSLGIGMAASGTSGRIDAANDVVAFSTSDIRLKENIKPIENALDKISKISGNTYDWKSELKDVHGYEGNDVGVIAQEVEAVLPQLVQDRDNGYKAVKYDKIVALLIEGIKEQQTQIHSLTLEIEKLKEQKGL